MPPQTLQSIIKLPGYQASIKERLAERAPQFISSLIQVGNSMPDVEPLSILAGGMTAAALDLPINKNLGFSWLVPFMDKRAGRKLAQFQIGYKGYIQLALRTSHYTRMNAQSINRDAFVGWDDMGQPRVDWDKYDPNAPVHGYWFGFDLLPATKQRFLWTVDRVHAHATRYSQAFRAKSGPWTTHPHEMGLKTVIANELRHWGMLSIQMEKAYRVDQSIQLEPDAEPVYLDNTDDDLGGDKNLQVAQVPDVRSGQLPDHPVKDSGSAHSKPESGVAHRMSPLILETAGDVSKPTTAKADISTSVEGADAPAVSKHKRPDGAQNRLAAGCSERGISFDRLRQWIVREQMPVPDVDSMSGFSELPEKMCALWLRAGDSFWKEVLK